MLFKNVYQCDPCQHQELTNKKVTDVSVVQVTLARLEIPMILLHSYMSDK